MVPTRSWRSSRVQRNSSLIPSLPVGTANPLSLILAALDQAKEAYVVMTPDTAQAAGRILYVNTAFSRMTGYAFEEVRDCAPTLLYNAETADLLREHVRETVGKNSHFSRDIVLRHKDGRESWAELQIVPVELPPHVPAHWVGILRDISERKLTEQSLLESQMRLNGILNSLSDVVWSMNIGLDRFIYLSPSTERVFGRSVEDFYHHAPLWFSMIHPEDRPLVTAAMREGLEKGGFEIDYRITRDDGETRWLRNRGRVIFDSRGAPVHYDGIADDITASKIAELHTERMAAFPRFNPNPVYELDETGRVTYSNDAALRLAQSLGFEEPGAILPADVAAVASQVLATGEPRLRREETYPNDRTLSWSYYAIPGTRIVHCYCGEITEKLRLESQLRQSEKLKSIGQLAGGVAHDFNNILTVIHGFTDMLLDREHADPVVTEHLGQIAVAAERARDLTRQLLTFSRRQVMKPTTLDLNAILRDLAKMLIRLLGEPIELQVQCGESGEGAELNVEGDRSMMEQIILNLVANARDAMPQGGVVVLETSAVEIKAADPLPHPEAKPGSYIRLSARDTGIGMDERTLSRIFEPFFTTKEMGKGTGLGLATVYGAVKQHEGWLQVESEVGSGTTFLVYLPAAKRPADVLPAAPAPAAPNAHRGHEIILVVEDEAPVRQLIATILRGSGYTVHEAKNGLDAIGVWEAKQDEIELLLTDLVMPGLISGIDLAEKLHNEKPELKVIFSSGYTAEVVGEKLAFDTATNFLAKPYLPSALLKMVRDCLDGKLASTSVTPIS